MEKNEPAAPGRQTAGSRGIRRQKQKDLRTQVWDQKTTAMLTRIRRYVGAAHAYSAVHVARWPEQVVELPPGLCRRGARSCRIDRLRLFPACSLTLQFMVFPPAVPPMPAWRMTVPVRTGARDTLEYRADGISPRDLRATDTPCVKGRDGVRTTAAMHARYNPHQPDRTDRGQRSPSYPDVHQGTVERRAHTSQSSSAGGETRYPAGSSRNRSISDARQPTARSPRRIGRGNVPSCIRW